MTAGELIKELRKYDKDTEVEVFANGEIYDILHIKNLEDTVYYVQVIEIGCGWEAKQ